MRANLSHSIPLLIECWCTIGISQKAILRIPLDVVRAIHCQVCNQGPHCEIIVAEGEVQLDRKQISSSEKVFTSSTLTLLPAYIPIELIFPDSSARNG